MHSLEDGSAMNGPLPRGWRKVRHPGEGIKCWRFINDATGEVTVQDPRLKNVPLPRGWRLSGVTGDSNEKYYINDEEGDNCVWYQDPRMMFESSMDRGAPLGDVYLR